MSRFSLFAALLFLVTLVAGCGSSSGSGTKPAATVNGQDISMAAYQKQVGYLRITSTGLETDPCGPKAFAGLCKQLKRNALETLIGNLLVNQYAAKHHITVSQADADAQWATILRGQFHGDQAVAHAYARSVGLTVADLKRNSREYLLQQRVMYDVTKHMALSRPAVRVSSISVSNGAELRKVQGMLKTGTSFNAAAQAQKQSKLTVCGQNPGLCGDRGWLPNELVPAQQKSVLTTPVGKIAGPFPSQSALTIILVEARIPNYNLSPTQELAVRQRLFATWLRGDESHAALQRYVTV